MKVIYFSSLSLLVLVFVFLSACSSLEIPKVTTTLAVWGGYADLRAGEVDEVETFTALSGKPFRQDIKAQIQTFSRKVPTSGNAISRQFEGMGEGR